MSDPDAGHARDALAKLEHLVVQDLFPTETAGYADVILPATSFFEKTGTFTNTDRTVQLARRVLERFTTDPAWPNPIWGRGTAEAYDPAQMETTIAAVKAALGV